MNNYDYISKKFINHSNMSDKQLDDLLQSIPTRDFCSFFGRIVLEKNHKFYDNNSENDEILAKRNLSIFIKIWEDVSIPTININDELLDLFLNTDNDFNIFRKIPYNTFIINNKILLDDGRYIIGLMIHNDNDRISLSGMFSSKNSETVPFHIDNTTLNLNNENKNFIIISLKEIMNLACNLIDYLNNNTDEYKIVTIPYDIERNKKRESRGKLPIPTTIHIHINEDKLRYYKDFSQKLKDKVFHYSRQFIVRGHWMNFLSDRYKDMRNKRTWVKPYWKGEGLKIASNVKIDT